MLRVDEIEKKIAELKEQKKLAIKQEKARNLKAEQMKKTRKRKIENRVKYIIGGYVLKNEKALVNDVLKSELRDLDRKALIDFLEGNY